MGCAFVDHMCRYSRGCACCRRWHAGGGLQGLRLKRGPLRLSPIAPCCCPSVVTTAVPSRLPPAQCVLSPLLACSTALPYQPCSALHITQVVNSPAEVRQIGGSGEPGTSQEPGPEQRGS